MLTFKETIIVGLFTAIPAAFLTWLGQILIAHLQRANEKTKFFREKLLDRYGEFVALVTVDLDRAKELESVVALGALDNDFTPHLGIDNKRHQLRRDLSRVSLQIQILEADATLSSLVETLAKSQPFMVWPFPPRWSEPGYTERFEEYKTAIREREDNLNKLVKAVLLRHSSEHESTQ